MILVTSAQDVSIKELIIYALLFSVFLFFSYEESKSTGWWMNHHDQAIKKDIECKKTGSNSQDCRNAGLALKTCSSLHGLYCR